MLVNPSDERMFNSANWLISPLSDFCMRSETVRSRRPAPKSFCPVIDHWPFIHTIFSTRLNVKVEGTATGAVECRRRQGGLRQYHVLVTRFGTDSRGRRSCRVRECEPNAFGAGMGCAYDLDRNRSHAPLEAFRGPGAAVKSLASPVRSRPLDAASISARNRPASLDELRGSDRIGPNRQTHCPGRSRGFLRWRSMKVQ
jgi:hypothetical protein